MSGPELLLLLPVGVAAGVINTLAGGGSFLTLSAMIWLGLPAPVANATNRVGVLAQSVTAMASYRRQAVEVPQPLGPQALVTSLGAVGGAALSLQLSPEAFEQVLAVFMLGMVTLSLLRPRAWLEPGAPRALRWPALLLAGAYGGFLQAGVGVLLLPALVVLGGLEPVGANARKVSLVALLTVPALALYAAQGWVAWGAGGLLALGSALGGWLGSRLSVSGGGRLIRGALLLVVLATSVRLVGPQLLSLTAPGSGASP